MLRPPSMNASWRSPIWVYAHPTMEELAEKIVETCIENCPDTPNVHDADWFRVKRKPEFRKTIQWGKFSDGFPNLFIEDVKEMAGKDVIFLASFHTPEVIFEQLSVIYAMPRYLARSFHLIMPYFPTGTMERVDTEGQVATAKTLATMLSNIPLTAKGPSQIMLFDIHALQERFYFNETVIPRLESAIPLLHKQMSILTLKENLAIAFPDDGAHKRFHNMFTDSPLIVCHKIRDGKKRIVKVKDGDPGGYHVIIVDDLVMTGGTLIECAKTYKQAVNVITKKIPLVALKERGATKVSAFVTHAVFPKQSWKRFTDCEVAFEQFWITDSVPHARAIATHPPFKLLSLSGVIADVLLGYDLKQM